MVIGYFVIASFSPAGALAFDPVPPLADWSHDDIGAPSTPGSHSNDTLHSPSGSLGGIADEAYIRHLPAQEGGDVRVKMTGPPTAGHGGVMVRDSLDDGAPYAFFGLNAAGESVLFARRSTGEAPEEINFGVQADWNWHRLVVGRSAVYVYVAEHDYSVDHPENVWTLIRAVETDLLGTDDPAGPVAAGGSTTFDRIVSTRVLHWSERETRAGDPDVTMDGAWTSVIAPADAISDNTIFEHPGGAGVGGEEVTFPLVINRSGHYRILVRYPGGTGEAGEVDVDIGHSDGQGGAAVTSLTLVAAPGEEPAWLDSGQTFEFEAGSVGNFVRVISRESAVVRADAVRAVWVPLSWQPVEWLRYFGRVEIDNNGQLDNRVWRSYTGPDGWYASTFAYHRLIGDGTYQFRVPTGDFNVRLGLAVTTAPPGGGPGWENIIHRLDFTSENGVTATGSGGGDLGGYGPQDWFTIERIGGVIQYRKNGILLHQSDIPSDEQLYLDCSLHEYQGSFQDSRVTGGWSDRHGNIDVDSYADLYEDYIIDYTSEDQY